MGSRLAMRFKSYYYVLICINDSVSEYPDVVTMYCLMVSVSSSIILIIEISSFLQFMAG